MENGRNEEDLIPDDVTIQVLCQARQELIERTCEAVKGAKQVIFHLYNSTSTLQRRVVFNMGREEVIKLATDGAELVKKHADTLKVAGTHVTLEYSPESYTATELDFAVDICAAVMEVWKPTTDDKMILNLPSTVEMATPNIYADQLEWFIRNLPGRDKAVISLHTHNDRGTGVAASELGLMAGAERIEGTLFGNGERTGNCDVINMAMNLFSQGVDPKLYLADMRRIVEVSEACTKIPIHVRTPYAGELVFTAFSGSHQDAIKKGFAHKDDDSTALWQVPYLPIDPADMGRSYRAIIRINSQSGKGGVAYVMEKEYGYQLPKEMHKELGKAVNRLADETGDEITPEGVFKCFNNEYIDLKKPLELIEFRSERLDDETMEAWAVVIYDRSKKNLRGVGNGPIAAFFNGLEKIDVSNFELLSYSEHSLGRGADSQAVSYIQLKNKSSGARCYGAGIDTNIALASIRGVVSALNRLMENRF